MVSIFNPENFSGFQIKTEPTIRVVKGDIATQPVDAIVNSADKDLARHGVISSAIFDAVAAAGGKEAAECLARICEGLRYPDSRAGDAYVTPGISLHASCIIHAVCPQWNLPHPIRGQRLTLEQWKLAHTLYETYGRLLTVTAVRFNSLKYRDSLIVSSFPGGNFKAEIGSKPVIAIPFLAVGKNGFPKELAAHIAIRAIRRFAAVWTEVRLIANSEETFMILSAAIQDPSDEWFDDAEHWSTVDRVCPQCGADSIAHSYGNLGLNRVESTKDVIEELIDRKGLQYGDGMNQWGLEGLVAYQRQCRKCQWTEGSPIGNYPGSLFFRKG
jgi:O-acetyl-ADP-ribose deacetylase (regulator of RNase III)